MSITAIGFLALYAIGLVMAFVRHPIYGLFAYLFAFYLHPPSAWWSSLVPDLRWSLVAAIVTLVATVIRSRDAALAKWYSTWPARLLLVYVAWMWLQGSWALHGDTHQEMVVLFSKYIILFYLVYAVCQDEKTIRAFMLAHVAGCFFLGWEAWQANVSGRLDSFGGPGIGDSNTLGMQLSTGLAFAGFLFLGDRGKERWAVFLAIPFILNGIILTGSRGAFAGLLAAGAAAWYLKPRFTRKWFYLAAALGLVLFLRLAHELFWERIESTVAVLTGEQAELDVSAGTRLALLGAQWEMAKDYPWGAGASGTAVLSPFYVDTENLAETGQRSSHNTFMAVLVNQGIPGAVIFALGVVWVVVTLRRLRRADRQPGNEQVALLHAAVGAALAASFVSGQFTNFLKAEVQIWCLALLAVMSSIVSARQASETAAAEESERTNGGAVARDAPRLGDDLPAEVLVPTGEYGQPADGDGGARR